MCFVLIRCTLPCAALHRLGSLQISGPSAKQDSPCTVIRPGTAAGDRLCAEYTTKAPTAPPTTSPTTSPTAGPTPSPSASPTDSPSVLSTVPLAGLPTTNPAEGTKDNEKEAVNSGAATGSTIVYTEKEEKQLVTAQADLKASLANIAQGDRIVPAQARQLFDGANVPVAIDSDGMMSVIAVTQALSKHTIVMISNLRTGCTHAVGSGGPPLLPEPDSNTSH